MSCTFCFHHSLVPSDQQATYKQKHETLDSLTAALRQQFSANQLRGTARRRPDLSPSQAAALLSCVYGSPTTQDTQTHNQVQTSQPRRGKKRPRSPDAFPPDARDPITLEPLSDSTHVFCYKRSTESVGAFDLPTLVQYLVTTGDFRDPETRVPFSPRVLKRLDSAAAKAGLPSPLAAQADKADLYKDQDATLMAITGVERLAHDFLAESMELLEQRPFNAGFTQVSPPPNPPTTAVQPSTSHQQHIPTCVCRVNGSLSFSRSYAMSWSRWQDWTEVRGLQPLCTHTQAATHVPTVFAEYTMDAIRMMIESVKGPVRCPTPNPGRHREGLMALLGSCLQQLQSGPTIVTHTATEMAFASLQRVQNTELVLPLEALGDVGLSALGLQLGQMGLGGQGVSFRILDAEMMSDTESSDEDEDGEDGEGDSCGDEDGEGRYPSAGGAARAEGSGEDQAANHSHGSYSSVGGSVDELEAILRLLGGAGGVSQDIAGGGLSRPRRRVRTAASAAASDVRSSHESGAVASRTRGAAANRAQARRPVRRARGSGRAAAGLTRATSNAQAAVATRVTRSRSERRRR